MMKGHTLSVLTLGSLFLMTVIFMISIAPWLVRLRLGRVVHDERADAHRLDLGVTLPDDRDLHVASPAARSAR